MTRLSPLPAQPASAIGSSRMAARCADVLKCNLNFAGPRWRILDRGPAKGNCHLGDREAVNGCEQGNTGPLHGGSHGRAGYPRTGGRAMWISRCSGPASAALDGGVLDRSLRDAVLPERSHLMVMAMTAVVADLMVHPGMGVQHPVLGRGGLGDRRGLAGGGGECRRRQYRSREQRGGNGLQHGMSSSIGDPKCGGRMTGLD